MVFRSRPYRQSVFLSPEQSSVARAEFQQNVVDLLPKLASLAKCTNCRIDGDTIYFNDNGLFELGLTPLLPSKNSILSLVVDRDRAPVGLSVRYEIALSQSPFDGSSNVTLCQGSLVVLNPSDMSSLNAVRLITPAPGGSILRLSASNVALPLKYLILYTLYNVSYALNFPYPSIIFNDIISMVRLPSKPQLYAVRFFLSILFLRFPGFGFFGPLTV